MAAYLTCRLKKPYVPAFRLESVSFLLKCSSLVESQGASVCLLDVALKHIAEDYQALNRRIEEAEVVDDFKLILSINLQNCKAWAAKPVEINLD